MKVSELEHKAAHVKGQLHTRGVFDTAGLPYNELVRKLALIKALEIDKSSEQNKWF